MAYPEGFEVPQDQGGPGEGNPVGGFGGNPQKTQDARGDMSAQFVSGRVGDETQKRPEPVSSKEAVYRRRYASGTNRLRSSSVSTRVRS
jgi:hypothetical protein